jgi:Patatin-like phospholipase
MQYLCKRLMRRVRSRRTISKLFSQSRKTYLSGSQSDELISIEQALIEEGRNLRRAKTSESLPWTGIAISGGGIRSAIVGLGAIQALASKDLLKQFDYLSSVSGGGYIATALQWWSWISQKGSLDDTEAQAAPPREFGISPSNFPFGTASAFLGQCDIERSDSPQGKLLSFLRWHGSYLTPGDGITIWSAVAVVLRTLFLNIMTWVPLGVLLFTTLLFFDYKLNKAKFQWVPNPVPDSIIPREWIEGGSELRLHLGFAFLIWASYFIVAFYSIFSLTISALSRTAYDITGEPRFSWGYIVLAAISVCFLGASWVAVVIFL